MRGSRTSFVPEASRESRTTLLEISPNFFSARPPDGTRRSTQRPISTLWIPPGPATKIKGRRVTRFNKSRQLSAIRDFDGAHFDFLAGFLFSEDYCVVRAAIIPRSVVVEHVVFVERTNSHKFILRDEIWEVADVRDVTAELSSVTL